MYIYIYTIDRKIERNTGPSHAQQVVCCSRTSRSRSTWHALSQSIDIGLLYTVYNVKYVHTYVYIYVCIYIYTRTYIHMKLWLNIQIHTNEVISDCPQPDFFDKQKYPAGPKFIGFKACFQCCWSTQHKFRRMDNTFYDEYNSDEYNSDGLSSLGVYRG